jgi:hypothetical protein
MSKQRRNRQVRIWLQTAYAVSAMRALHRVSLEAAPEVWPAFKAQIKAQHEENLRALDLIIPEPCASGARPIEQRSDWPRKVEIAKRWVARWKSGKTTQEAAANLLDYDVDTLRTWARRAKLE